MLIQKIKVICYKSLLFIIIISIPFSLINLKSMGYTKATFDSFINIVKHGDKFLYSKFYKKNLPILNQNRIKINIFKDKTITKPRGWHRNNLSIQNLLIFPTRYKINNDYDFYLTNSEQKYLSKYIKDTVKFRKVIMQYHFIMLSDQWHKEKNWGLFIYRQDTNRKRNHVYLLPMNWRNYINK